MPVSTIQELFGQIDIYLFDQLLKGRISPGMRILDAGCGSGRNLVYFLREGYGVYAVDPDVQAVESVRALARMFAPALPESNFSVEAVEHMSFNDACADVVICNTVLHFARDDAHFESMLHGAWRVLKPGGQVIYGVPIERPLMVFMFRMLGCDIRKEHFSTELDVSFAAQERLQKVRVLQMRSRPPIFGPVYEVGHFLKHQSK